jgi:hypothetical protein
MNMLEVVLAERKEWHLWVIEYGITHSFMCLALHPGSFPRHIKLGCYDCVYIEGFLQGGPYVLKLTDTKWHGDSMRELRDAKGSFRLVCGRIKVLCKVD